MSNQTFYKILLRSCYASISIILFFFTLNSILNGSVWQGMTISKSALTVEYCELNQVDKFFHQTMNTYSNIVYFFFGILILQIAWEDYKNRELLNLNRLQQFPLLSALVGFCFIYLCFGSAFFHASLTWVGQRVDMNGTYGLTLTLLSVGFYHVFHKIELTNGQKNLWIIGLLILILAFFEIALMVSSSTLIPVLILLSTAFTGIHYFQFRKERFISLGILSFVLIIIAIKIRTLDVQKVGCEPHSLYQGHAVWHLLTAMSSFCSYAFFRFTALFVKS
jgi:Ceramidase